MHPLLQAFDLNTPGLEAVRAAYQQGNVSRALNELVAYYRARPEPDPALLALPDPTVIDAADDAMEHRFTFYNEASSMPMGSFDWTHKPGIDWEWTWALNRHQWWPQLASAYLATQNERYAQELDMLIRSWVGGHPPATADQSAWRTIEAGIRTYAAWPSVLSALKVSPSISLDTWLYYLRSIREHAEFLLAHPKGGNWLLMETNGVLTCGLVFPEFKRAGHWVKSAVQVFEREMQDQVHPDGAQVEYSSGYHFVCLRNFEMALDKLDRAARPAARLSYSYRERLSAMWQHVMYMLRPDGRLPMLNDSDNRSVASDLLVAGQKHRRPDFVYAATHGQRGMMPDETSHRFDWSRRAVLRSDWSADALYAMLESAPFGYGHQHEDALTFELFAYGQPLLGTMGRYTYAKIPLRRYLISSDAHNVVLIDGQGQDQRGLAAHRAQNAERPAEWTAQGPTQDPWISTPGLDVAYGCYDGPWQGGLQDLRWERWLAFLKPDAQVQRPGLWLIRDRVSGEGTHDITSLLHFFPGWVALDERSGQITTGYENATGNLLVAFTTPQDLIFEAIHGQEDPPRGWYSEEYGKVVPAWEMRATRPGVTLTPDQPYEGFMALVPFRGSAAPAVSVLAMSGGARVTVDGRPWDISLPV